jgi:phosphatidate phosphatase APP1
MNWRVEFRDLAREAFRDIDDVAEAAWRQFSARVGLDKPRQIVAFRGYGNAERIWVKGRLLANKLQGGPQEDDNWWDNIQATYARWQSHEVPGAEIRLRYGTDEITVVTNEEGYYEARFDRIENLQNDLVVASYDDADGSLTAEHGTSVADGTERFVLISDVDDTVIHTHITDLLLAAKLTFLNNARTRKPLPGAAELYRAFARSTQTGKDNPVVYLSNSGNMYDLLHDFLDLNEFPIGPLLLRDSGIGADTSDHKIKTLHELMDRFAPLPVILIGDSGQHDADIYAKVAESFADRILAIYIRDINPGSTSSYDENVDWIIQRSNSIGVRFQLVETSIDIARDAAQLGLIDESAITAVEADIDLDQKCGA